MAPPGRPRRLHYAWVIAALSAAAVIGALGFGRFGYTVILPAMEEHLALSDVQAADLATGNMLGYLVLSILGGVLAARLGSRLVVTVFLLVTCGGMVLTGLARGYGGALFARTLTGMGSGGVNVPVMALAAAWFSPRRRGMAMGITVSGSSIGLFITGLLIPPILERFGGQGWRYGWYVLAASTGAIAVLSALLLRERPEELGLRPFGGGPVGAPGGRLAGRVASGAPPWSKWRQVYAAPQVWRLGAVYAAFGFSYVIYATFFVRYLTGEGGYALQRAGSLWSTVGIASVASGFVWGAVSDRLGRKLALCLVLLLQGGSYVLFGLWRAPAGFLVSALLFALTAWSVPALMAASVGDLTEARLAPAVFGFISLFLSIGQVAGPFAAGRIASATGSFAAAFVTAGAVAVAGAVRALLRPAAGSPAGEGTAGGTVAGPRMPR
ncbi:MAG: YbfB/YjiJ family MFS transporter [Spirochaetales bacterium]|nr:YbfB/YjiJ family MFS transporter [Spirochaetales bacterium]